MTTIGTMNNFGWERPLDILGPTFSSKHHELQA